MKCEHCGMELGTDAQKCSSCGAVVNKVETTTNSVNTPNMGIESMKKPKGFGIAALVLDILCWLMMAFAVAMLVFCQYVEGTVDILGFIIYAMMAVIYGAPVNILFMILGLIFAIVQRKKTNRVFSKVVLTFSIITFIVGILYTVFVVYGFFLSA